MLHVGVLPHHDRWGDVFANLAFVVVDEAHVYRGVFGSHVANVLRRLRRIARLYDSDPQFLLASATIANAGELAEALTGRRDGDRARWLAPAQSATVALWNPPLVDAELGLRASALGEASRLMAELVSRGLRTICFAKSRKSAELMHRFTARARRPRATASGSRRTGPATQPAQRREIERRLVAGELLGVSATDALELGIDIGLLDCVISDRLSRHGRLASASNGAVPDGEVTASRVLVASEDALDQFFMREPETLLGRRVEAAILDHANPRVLERHVSRPPSRRHLTKPTPTFSGPEALERAALLPELEHTPAGCVWAGRDYPAARISLRSASPESFTVVERLDWRRARPGGARARLLDRPRRVRSTSTSASRTA